MSVVNAKVEITGTHQFSQSRANASFGGGTRLVPPTTVTKAESRMDGRANISPATRLEPSFGLTPFLMHRYSAGQDIFPLAKRFAQTSMQDLVNATQGAHSMAASFLPFSILSQVLSDSSFPGSQSLGHLIVYEHSPRGKINTKFYQQQQWA